MLKHKTAMKQYNIYFFKLFLLQDKQEKIAF